MIKKNCQNCKQEIVHLEESYVYYGQTICKACMIKLEKQFGDSGTSNGNIDTEIPIAELQTEQNKDMHRQNPEAKEKASADYKKESEHFDDKISSENDDSNSPKKVVRKSGGRTQIVIGIIIGILLLFNPGTGLLRVYTEYSITQNEALMTELGYDPADFQNSLGYWIERYAFHAFGLAVILLYVIFVASKKLRGAQVAFLLCLLYFLAVTYSNITSLSEEQRMRGYTVAGWIGRIVSWLPKLVIELGLLIQGLLGVRKQEKLKGIK